MQRYFLVLLSLSLLASFAVGCSQKEAPKAEKAAPAEKKVEAPKETPKAEPKGHAHQGGHGPHDGVMAKLKDGAGYVEVKLHDDKGDLEVWLAQDEKIIKPIDLPLDAALSLTFKDKGDKVVKLKVRNQEHNEDEDGTPNIREGKTNYFIYPGDSGEPSDWLKGQGFKSNVSLSFSKDGKAMESEGFTLTPHHPH